MNWALFSVISTIASGVTIGLLMMVILITKIDTIQLMTIVCIVGFLLSLPISYVLTKKMQALGIVKTPTQP